MEKTYFKYKEFVDGGKRYVKVSMDFHGIYFEEYCRVYWFHMVWGMPFAKMRILKKILNEIR